MTFGWMHEESEEARHAAEELADSRDRTAPDMPRTKPIAARYSATVGTEGRASTIRRNRDAGEQQPATRRTTIKDEVANLSASATSGDVLASLDLVRLLDAVAARTEGSTQRDREARDAYVELASVLAPDAPAAYEALISDAQTDDADCAATCDPASVFALRLIGHDAQGVRVEFEPVGNLLERRALRAGINAAYRAAVSATEAAQAGLLQGRNIPTAPVPPAPHDATEEKHSHEVRAASDLAAGDSATRVPPAAFSESASRRKRVIALALVLLVAIAGIAVATTTLGDRDGTDSGSAASNGLPETAESAVANQASTAGDDVNSGQEASAPAVVRGIAVLDDASLVRRRLSRGCSRAAWDAPGRPGSLSRSGDDGARGAAIDVGLKDTPGADSRAMVACALRIPLEQVAIVGGCFAEGASGALAGDTLLSVEGELLVAPWRGSTPDRRTIAVYRYADSGIQKPSAGTAECSNTAARDWLSGGKAGTSFPVRGAPNDEGRMMFAWHPGRPRWNLAANAASTVIALVETDDRLWNDCIAGNPEAIDAQMICITEAVDSAATIDSMGGLTTAFQGLVDSAYRVADADCVASGDLALSAIDAAESSYASLYDSVASSLGGADIDALSEAVERKKTTQLALQEAIDEARSACARG